MLAGELYRPDDPDIIADQAETARWLARYNTAAGSSPEVLRALLAERIPQLGENVTIRPPFFCD